MFDNTLISSSLAATWNRVIVKGNMPTPVDIISIGLFLESYILKTKLYINAPAVGYVNTGDSHRSSMNDEIVLADNGWTENQAFEDGFKLTQIDKNLDPVLIEPYVTKDGLINFKRFIRTDLSRRGTADQMINLSAYEILKMISSDVSSSIGDDLLANNDLYGFTNETNHILPETTLKQAPFYEYIVKLYHGSSDTFCLEYQTYYMNEALPALLYNASICPSFRNFLHDISLKRAIGQFLKIDGTAFRILEDSGTSNHKLKKNLKGVAGNNIRTPAPYLLRAVLHASSSPQDIQSVSAQLKNSKEAKMFANWHETITDAIANGEATDKEIEQYKKFCSYQFCKKLGGKHIDTASWIGSFSINTTFSTIDDVKLNIASIGVQLGKAFYKSIKYRKIMLLSRIANTVHTTQDISYHVERIWGRKFSDVEKQTLNELYVSMQQIHDSIDSFVLGG